MADEDNFDIDIYGDGEGMDEDSKEFYKQENEKSIALREQKQAERTDPAEASDQVVDSKDNPEQPEDSPATNSQRQQGVKRKGDSDERRIDVGATNALMISDLHWWTTEDDIRGWANEADSEDELKDITFSEHKVNGKSKGQAFIEFTSPQASTAVKRKIESLSSGPNNSRKFSVIFTSASSNPFKTLPKDAPARTKDERSQRNASASYSAPTHHSNYNSGNNFRGGRGSGYNNRGGYTQNYNNNRNFSNAGNNNNFNNGSLFQSPMPMMGGVNNFGVRGGMMGNSMRGNMAGMRGRGGAINNNTMMPMGMMGMGMAMNPMMTGMGNQGFGNNGPQFNPGMFNQNNNQGMNGGEWGHGAKRQRHD